MRARRTIRCNKVFVLPGGTEDNWLHAEVTEQDGDPIILSTWVLSDAERQQIAAGHNIELAVWGTGTPPVSMRTSDVPLGRPQRSDDPTGV